MPHKIIQKSSSRQSTGTQVGARCFCEKQQSQAPCFSELPAGIQKLINEYYASIGQVAQDCTCNTAAPSVFTCFPKLPVKIQERIAQYCMPSSQLRYLEFLESVNNESTSTLLRKIPAAASTNRLFLRCFKEQWERLIVPQENSVGGRGENIRTYINFQLDQLVIDINRPLTSVSEASCVVQHRSSQRPSWLPVHIDEYWAHGKARAEIRDLPAALFTEMPHLETYWLIINNIPAAHLTWAQAEEVVSHCGCVFSPMLKCLSNPVETRCHAFRYHVKTAKVECAEMDRGHELNLLLKACHETKPNFAARVTFVYDDNDITGRGQDGLDWWPLYPPGLLTLKFEKLKKRLDWGLVTDVLRSQVKEADEKTE